MFYLSGAKGEFNMNNTENIGARIHKRRKELNLTLQYVAERMGVNKSTIQRYESGKIRRIKLPMLLFLAGILDTTPEWLTNGTGKKDEPPVVEKLNKPQ